MHFSRPLVCYISFLPTQPLLVRGNNNIRSGVHIIHPFDARFFTSCYILLRMSTHLRQYSSLKYTQSVSVLDILWVMNVLAAGLSPRRPELNPRPIRMVSVMDKLTLDQVLSFLVRMSVCHFHYHSSSAPCEFIHLPPTLCKLST
jgi:hypothetical protein